MVAPTKLREGETIPSPLQRGAEAQGGAAGGPGGRRAGADGTVTCPSRGGLAGGRTPTL